VTLILLVIVAALLLIPFDISGRLARAENRTSTRFSVTWLFGVIGYQRKSEDGEATTAILLFGRRVHERREEEKEEKEDEEEERRLRIDAFMEILSELPNLCEPIHRLLNGLMDSLHLTRASAEVTVGLMDPWQTGMLMGAVYAGLGVLSPWSNTLDLQVYPVFDEVLLEGHVLVDLRIRLLWLVYPALRLFLNRSTRRMMRIAGENE
jgi:hypothetical protein